MKRFWLFLFCAAGLTGCALLRLSGNKQGLRAPDPVPPALTEVNPGGRPRRNIQEEIPEPESDLRPLFYSDLGPDKIDVSSYPAQQKYNYTVYSRVCSQCHGLARSINAPAVSRAYWEFYLLTMRTRSGLTPYADISWEEARTVMDFLVYDSKVRKTGKNESAFNELTEELKRRFKPLLEKRLQQLQNGSQPRLLPQ